MIVAPDREMPGIMATVWQRPIRTASRSGSLSAAWCVGRGA